MSTTNTISNANGLFKERYAKNLKFLQPDGVKLLNMIPFSETEKTGASYNQPVVLQMEHGLTWGSADEDGFGLNPPIAGAVKMATVQGHPLVLRTYVGLNTIQRAVSKGEASFANAIDVYVENMLRSMNKALEIELLYGQEGYGQVASISGLNITLNTDHFASGIWVGSEKMPIEIRSSSGILRGSCVITKVDLENMILTVDAMPAGVVAGDVIWRKSSYNKEFKGLHKILSQTNSTLFGIDVEEYSIFKGNKYDCSGGDLTFEKIAKAAALAISKGQEGKLVLICNPITWANLLDEQYDLRSYDSSYNNKISVTGSENIKFFSQNGEIEIVSSIFCKQGFAYLIQPNVFKRIGSTDITFELPGEEGKFFKPVPDSHSLELRAMCDQALFCEKVGVNVLLHNIVNS